MVLGAKKILVYKRVHEFFETTRNCSSSPLYEISQKNRRMRRVVGAEGKSTAAYIDVREETFYPMATH